MDSLLVHLMANPFELDGLTKLFAEIREKNCIEELSPQYQKFAEWLRIEYVNHLLAVSFFCTNQDLGLPQRCTTFSLPRIIHLNSLPRPSESMVWFLILC